MLVFGTRPEAIKMCPLIDELKKRPTVNTLVCVTGQHRQMLDQVLTAFGIVPDYNLSIMTEKQTLFEITQAILGKLQGVLKSVHPDIVLVHGDTSSSFAAALAEADQAIFLDFCNAVALFELHAHRAAGSLALLRDLVLLEADRIAALGNQHQGLPTVRKHHGYLRALSKLG